MYEVLDNEQGGGWGLMGLNDKQQHVPNFPGVETKYTTCAVDPNSAQASRQAYTTNARQVYSTN